MKTILRFFPALMLAGAALPLAAQQPVRHDSTTAQVSPAASRSDSVTVAASELEQALTQLAVSVQAMATRIATDPALRLAAIKMASSLVSTAQQVVTDDTASLQAALKVAADKIAAAVPAPAPATSSPSKPPSR
jgi:hypothetical protein